MAKPPPCTPRAPIKNDAPGIGQTGLDGDQTTPQWSTFCTMGNQMMQLGNQLKEIGSQLLHVGSVFLQDSDAPLNAAALSVTPGNKEMYKRAQDGAVETDLPHDNKRVRYVSPTASLDINPPTESCTYTEANHTPFKVTPSSHTCVSRTSAITPSSDACLDIPTNQTHPEYFFPSISDQEVDMNLWKSFSEEMDDNVEQDDELEQFFKDIADVDADESHCNEKRVNEKKQGQVKEGKYLKKLVADTNMNLKTYFKHNDKNLICLLGRGAHNNHHPGNQSYRHFVSERLQDYKSLSKEGKEKLTNAVVQDFEAQGRRFFEMNANGEWEALDQESARSKIRAKISQRFRDA